MLVVSLREYRTNNAIVPKACNANPAILEVQCTASFPEYMKQVMFAAFDGHTSRRYF